MRTPSNRCVPHVCTITYNTWNTDQDGGRQVKASSTQANVPCFVQPGKSMTTMESSDEGGSRRVTEIVPGKVYFITDVSINTNDLIQWIDQTSIEHNYVVLGYHPPCGSGVLWRAEVEERK